LTPDFCAMSLSDTSIEERSIINSLAATSSFSAVVVLPPANLVDTLVLNCNPMARLSGEMRGADNLMRAPHSRV
jgi:hypothetical protein